MHVGDKVLRCLREIEDGLQVDDLGKGSLLGGKRFREQLEITQILRIAGRLVHATPFRCLYVVNIVTILLLVEIHIYSAHKHDECVDSQPMFSEARQSRS